MWEGSELLQASKHTGGVAGKRRGLILRVTACGLLIGGIALGLAPSRIAAQLPPAPKAPVRPTPPTGPAVPKPKAPPAAAPRAATPPAEEAKPEAGQSAQNPGQGPAQNPTPSGAWVARCVSESRQSPLECSVEQTVALNNSGQLFASLLVRVPADTRAPMLMIQVPNGLYIPAGLTLQVDEAKPQAVPLQTCDPKGCYGGMPVSAEFLASLKSGKRLTMTFQNMAKSNVTVPLALDNFAEAYQKIQ